MTATILPLARPERASTVRPLGGFNMNWTYEYNVHGTCLFQEDVVLEITTEAGGDWTISEVGVERWCVRKGGHVLRWLDADDFMVKMIRDHITHHPDFINTVAERIATHRDEERA